MIGFVALLKLTVTGMFLGSFILALSDVVKASSKLVDLLSPDV